jgi:hypothetical protein
MCEVLHQSVGAFYRAGREVEVAGIVGVAVVNGVINGAITRVKEGGGDYSQLKRVQHY